MFLGTAKPLIIIKKQKKLMGIFKNMGGNFLGGDFLGGGRIHQGGIWLVGIFQVGNSGWEFSWYQFYIRAQFPRKTKSSLIKIRKPYFLDATIFLAKDFFGFLSQHFVLVLRERRKSMWKWMTMISAIGKWNLKQNVK